MWREARRSGPADLARFGPASVAIGVFSFAYHASYTFALQFFDFVAMFLFCFTVLARNAVRLHWVPAARETRFFAIGVIGLSALVPPLFYAGFPIQSLVGILIAIGLAQEMAPAPARRAERRVPDLPRRDSRCSARRRSRRCSTSRASRAIRTSWLQGHAVWHVLSALALAAFFRFYAELPSRGAAGARESDAEQILDA